MYTSKHSPHGNKKSSAAHFRKRLLPLAVSAALFSTSVYAGPEGGSVVGGAGSINQNGNTTTINQTTDLMAIDWQSFNVNSDERVEFVQPDASSISLNRILSNNGSLIQGQIDANGQVILVNTNGVIFGKNAVINAGGLLASGLDIDPNDFMNRDFAFSALENAEGKVINSGLINAATGGSVSLLGKQVKNDGLIIANLGSVNLAAGKDAVVTFDPSGLMGIKVTKEILQSELGVDAAVINSGDINAAGGQILLSASVSGEIFTQAIKINDQARSVVVHEDGSFTLGAGADVVNTGKLDVSENAVAQNAGQIVAIGENVRSSGQILANTKNSAQTGNIEIHSNTTTELLAGSVTSASALESGSAGDIKVLGKNVGLLDNAQVNATGVNGGGEVLIGGDETGDNKLIRNADFIYLDQNSQVHTDASLNGNGGKLITFAKDTARIYGELTSFGGIESGNGGFIETSGLKGFDIGTVPLAGARSLHGLGGTWLIDPYDIEIASGSKQTTGSGSNERVSIPGFADPDPYPGNSINDNYSNNNNNTASRIHDQTIEWAFDQGINVIIKTGPSTSVTTSEGGNITLLDGVTIDFNENNNATLTLRANNNIVLNGSVSDNNGGGNLNLVLNAGGTITQGTNSVLNVDGTTTIDAAGQDVTLNGANDFANLAITAARDVGITDINGINLGTSTLSGDLILTASGALTDSGSIIFTTNNAEARFNVGSANNVTLNSANNDFKSIIITSANDVQIIDDNSIDIGASAISGNFNLSAEGITDSGAINVSGTNKVATFTATGFDIELDHMGNIFSRLQVAARDVDIIYSSALDLGASTISRDFNLSAGGVITDSGTISVASGITTLTAQNSFGDGRAINLNDANNFNQVNIVNASDVTLNDTNSIVISAASISGILNLTANNGSITDTGNIIADSAILSATGEINLNNDNDFISSVAILNAQNVTLKDINSLTLGASGQNHLNISGVLDVTANGIVNIFADNNLTIAKIDSGLNTNAININGSANTNNFTFNANSSWTGALTINGADNTDQFTFSSGMTANGNLTVNGGVGNDVFSISTALTNATFNGDSDDDTFNLLTTGITATVDGGTDTDTIVGPNSTSNTWQINTINSSVGSVSFGGIENITGGDGADTFNVNGDFVGTLYGGNGNDSFNLLIDLVTGNIDGGENTGDNDVVELAATGLTINVGELSNIETLIGNMILGITPDSTLQGSNTTTTWENLASSTSGISGEINDITFENFATLQGGSGNDTFIFTSGNTASGITIDAGDGTDTVDVTALSNQTFDLSSGDFFGISDVENLKSAVGRNNALKGVDNQVNTWNITAANTGNLNNTISFEGFNRFIGGSGVGSSDEFKTTDLNSNLNIVLAPDVTSTALTGGNYYLANMETLTLNTTANNTLTSNLSGDSTWTIGNNNDQILNAGQTINFSGVRSLMGGADNDIFTFTANPPTGFMVNGGTAGTGTDTVNISALNNYMLTIGSSGFQNIESYIGSSTNTLAAQSGTNIWTLNNDNTGTLGSIGFSGFSRLVGGSGSDTFNANGVTFNLNVVLSSDPDVRTISVSGGNYYLASMETVNLNTATVNTLTSSLSNASTWTLNSSNSTIQNSGRTVTFTGVSSLVGGAGDDRFDFNVVPTVIANGGSAGNDIVNIGGINNYTLIIGSSFFQNIDTYIGNSTNTLTAQAGTNTWNMTAANNGTLNNTISFQGFNRFIGGSGSDEFKTTDFNSNVNLVLASETDVKTISVSGGNFYLAGMETLTLRESTTNTLTSNLTGESTWTIGATDQISNAGKTTTFMGIDSVIGGNGNDTFLFTTAPTNTLRVNGGLNVNTGEIDTVDVSSVTGYTVLVGTNGFENIERYIGGLTNTFAAQEGTNNWAITGANSGTLNDTILFENFNYLEGGTGTDNFIFSGAGALNNGGFIDGGTGALGVIDTVNFSALTGSVNIQISDTNGYKNIERYVGNTGSTLGISSGTNTWNLSAMNAGSLTSNLFSGSISFESFSNISGGSGRDVFELAAGSGVTGIINGGGDNDRLRLSLGASLPAGKVTFNGGTLTDADEIVIEGSMIDQVVYTPAGADGYSQLLYSNVSNSYQLNFLVGSNATVSDNVAAQTLRIDGSSAADSIVLQNSLFNVNTSQNINYSSKTNLLLSELGIGSSDTVVISGNVDFSLGTVTIENASVSVQDNSSVLRAQNLILDSVAAVGSSAQRFNISADNLSLNDISSSIYLDVDGGVNLVGLRTFGAVDLLADSITSAAALSAQGSVTIVSQSGNVTLENQQNIFNGALTLQAVGDIALENSVATNITSIDAGGNLDLTSGGAVTATGVVIVDGNTTLAVNGNASFLNAANDFNDVFIENAMDVSITDTDRLILRTLNMQGALATTSQALDVINGTVQIGSGVLNVLGATAANLNSEITATSSLTVNATGLTVNSGITAASLVLNGQTGDVIINSAITATNDLGVSGQFVDVNNTVRGNTVALSANGDLDVGAAVTATAGLDVRSVTGDLRVTGNLTSASLVASANDLLQIGGVLDVQGNVDLDSVAGDIEQSGRINSAGGIITLDTVNNINMISGAEINNTLGEVRLTAGNNINVQRVNAGTGLIVVNAINGEVIDANTNEGNDVTFNPINFIGNRLEITANSGIGKLNVLEMAVAELALVNKGTSDPTNGVMDGNVNFYNSTRLQIDRLLTNGDVNIVGGGDIVFNNISEHIYDKSQIDATVPVLNGLSNVNYELGKLNISTNGSILATGKPRNDAPDVVAREAIFLATGTIGAGNRPLVVYVKDMVNFVAPFIYRPFWAFDTKPADYKPIGLEIDILGLSAASGEEMVEVEEAADIDPAIFANVRNYFFDDVSIRMPSDQLYDDELEEKRKNQLSLK